MILRGHATRPFVNIPMPHSYAEALLISEKERETQNHYHYSLSLLYLNLLPGMSVNDGIIEELPNSQKEEGGTMTKTMTAGNGDITSRNWYDA